MDAWTLILTPPFRDLSGKVACVTGGSRGIGAQTCRMLADHGVKVAVSGRDPAAIEQVVAAIRSSGQDAIALVADCTDFAASCSPGPLKRLPFQQPFGLSKRRRKHRQVPNRSRFLAKWRSSCD